MTHFVKEGRRCIDKKMVPRLHAVKTETHLQVQSVDQQEHCMSQAGCLFPESMPV